MRRTSHVYCVPSFILNLLVMFIVYHHLYLIYFYILLPKKMCLSKRHLNAWKLKNHVEIQDFSQNLFLFKFTTKRDHEFILRSGPWSFDRSMLVLNWISGEEQPSDLNMHYGSFWVRIYELPLMLRSKTMARKIESILEMFEQMDLKEAHRNDQFPMIKVIIDLKDPLKSGTIVKIKENNLRVHFKY